MNYLPGLVLNYNPVALNLANSWDYRCEPLALGFEWILNKQFGSKVDTGLLTC